MWFRNAFTERLNLDFPILSAPMGRFSTSALAAAVSNAGGLGGIGLTGLSLEDARRRIEAFRQQSAGSVNLNLLLYPATGDVSALGQRTRQRLQKLYDEKELGAVPEPKPRPAGLTPELADLLIQSRSEAMSFHFGMPDREIVQSLKEIGSLILCSATTVDEARALEAAGADAIIAQGAEAGGHRGTFSNVGMASQPGLFALLPQVVDAVSVPVIAAGGVADGRMIAAAIMLGANAVQLGTAFLRCGEANMTEAHRVALRRADDACTVVTSTYTGKPARVLNNRFVEELSDLEDDVLPFRAHQQLTQPLSVDDDPTMMALYSGQSAALTREMSASDLVGVLVKEVNECFRSFA